MKGTISKLDTGGLNSRLKPLEKSMESTLPVYCS